MTKRKIFAAIGLIFCIVFLVEIFLINNPITGLSYKNDYPVHRISSSDLTEFKELCKTEIETNLGITVDDSYLRVNACVPNDFGIHFYVKTSTGKHYKYEVKVENWGRLLTNQKFDFPTELYFKEGLFGYYLTSEE